MRLALLLLLTATLQVSAQTVKMPERAQGKQERKIRITIESDSKPVDWIIVGGTQSDDFDVDEVIDRKAPANSVTLAFVGYRPGTYWLFAANAKADVPGKAVCMIVVEPKEPPIPPIPPLPPPPLNDPLYKDLVSTYAVDTGPQKGQQVTFLAAIYHVAAGYANDPAVDTADKLATLVRDARRAKIPDTDLVKLRDRITAEVAATMPSQPGTPMSPDLRTKATALYNRIAMALEAIKP